jgi:Fe-S cluster assembly protein SufD
VRKIFNGKFSAVHNEAHQLFTDIKKLSVVQNSVKLIFINGWMHKDSALNTTIPKNIIVENLATNGLLLHHKLLKKYWNPVSKTFPYENSWEMLLNSALWTDGALVYVPDNTHTQNPIEIINIFTGNNEILVSPRHLIIAGKNAEVIILEHNVSVDLNVPIIVNGCTEIFAGENSKIQFYRIQDHCKNVSIISSIYVTQEKKSSFDSYAITLNSDWIRNNSTIALNGEYCQSYLNGLFITSGDEHVDNHTFVQHNQPNCQSNQLYKGILDGKSTGVFNGKILVNRGAQKTNAYQSAKNILLSDDATINTRPQLEIYADDVKCSHGASTGKLDEEAMFYLRSRGLSESTARAILLFAFANDVLKNIHVEPLKNYLEERIGEKLSRC